ncbi:MAG TPA: BlaI/MecI/CopY family transcriptional regulator [Acidimicrobiales bacterium]|nr:BlaI/MecI/CopY family transcriptional regulator [Acidimicrobiales bacterium]
MAKLAMGELEASVMDVLWRHGGWMTPGEVHDVLAPARDLAYTTAMTILVRLWKKGRLERRRDGRAYAYHALETRAEHTAGRMREILAGADDRTTALSHFIETLDSRERTQLRRLLGDRRR